MLKSSNMNSCFSEFYHGTDARILRMPHLVFKDRLGNCYEMFVESITQVYMNKAGYEHYQYDDIYFTTWKSDAVMYSIQSYAFGEIGKIAYGIISGMMRMAKSEGNTMDIFLPMKPFIDFAESIPEPVVLKIDNIDSSFLRNEDGTFVDVENVVCSASYRYLKDIDLSKFEIANDEEIQSLKHKLSQLRINLNISELF